MKVFNLTDVSTRVLLKQHMVNVPFTVGGVTIKPGESGEVKARYRSQCQRLLQMEALAIGAPPGGYAPATVDTEPAPPSPVPPPPSPTEPAPALMKTESTELFPEEPPPDTQSSPGDEEGSEEEKPKRRRGRRKKG